jgi:hypothetical protein
VVKIRQIHLSLLAFCLLLGLGAQSLAARAQNAGALPDNPPKAEFTSSQLTQPERESPNWKNDQSIPDSYELVAENQGFQLYANKTTLGFIVVDKRSGYAWHSTLDEIAADDRLNKTWRAFASSGISMEYLDQKAVNKRISITNSTHSIEVKPIDQGFQASVTFNDFSITIGVIVTLEESGVRVEVPSALMKAENPDFKIGLLYVYPFFGATRGDSVPGYMFIPDGSGSLIRFSSVTKAKTMFFERYYGPDLGMIATLPYDRTINRPNKISVPVFGMAHGVKENAFISIVEQGAAFGQIQAHPSGIITNFNFLYHAFVYNESFFQATNRSGDGVTTLQRKTNAYDVKIHYRFLTKEDSDYVGMAKSYQQYLIEKGILKKVSDPNTSIGIRLEFLGGEKEKILFWNRSIPMTTVGQMADILQDLKITNPEVIYYGWQPLGASSMPPKSLQVESSLGSVDQLRALTEKITAGGGNFSLYLDPQAALQDEDGYSPRNDLAMSITNVNLQGYNRKKINYYLNYEVLSDRFSTLSKDVFSRLKAGLALDGMSSMLYSDFKNGHILNREDTITKYQALLAENKGRTSFYMPNDYLFGYMKAYYDMPLTNNGYIYTTDAVPFLQIVFAGYVPLYGPALNFSSDVRQDLLRQVDFDVYPSYFLSYDVTAKILNTSSNWIFTSAYQQWSQEIKRNYQWMNNLLGPVKGQRIVSRQVLEEGVVATTYSNGKQIIVNYNNTPFSTGDVTVNSEDAVIREVLP